MKASSAAAAKGFTTNIPAASVNLEIGPLPPTIVIAVNTDAEMPATSGEEYELAVSPRIRLGLRALCATLIVRTAAAYPGPTCALPGQSTTGWLRIDLLRWIASADSRLDLRPRHATE